MTYRTLSLPLPVRNYRAEMVRVSDENGNGCTLHWDSWFEATIPLTGGTSRRFMSSWVAKFAAGIAEEAEAEPNRREFNGKAANARPAAPALDVSYDVDDLGHPSVTAVVCLGEAYKGPPGSVHGKGVEHHLHLDVSFGEVR